MADTTSIEAAKFERATREIDELRKQVRELRLQVERALGIGPDRPKLALVADNAKQGA